MKLAHRRAHGIVWPILWIALIIGFAATMLLLPTSLAAADTGQADPPEHRQAQGLPR